MSYGQAESRIAMLQEDYLNAVKEDYMDTLERGMQEYREYLNLRKKLESRRLDYDAKLSKLQKAKKEKPELEQEMQASKMKYEETEYDLIQKMMYLQDFEVSDPGKDDPAFRSGRATGGQRALCG